MSFKMFMEDVASIVNTLSRIYNNGSKGWVELTLTGEKLNSPYPVLKARGKLIRGVTINDGNFHKLDVKPHNKKVLSIDASLKLLFDLGPLQIIEAKASCSIWRGKKVLGECKVVKRASIVRSRIEAEAFLLKTEVKEALRMVGLLKEGDHCILDRGLMATPVYMKSVRNLMGLMDKKLYEKGIFLEGISKISRMKLNTNESLLGYLVHVGEATLRGQAWCYHPLFHEYQYPKWYLGQPVIAKLDSSTNNVFRIDVSNRSLRLGLDLPNIIGQIAYVCDPATPGYPYPSISAHKGAKISEEELMLDRLRIIDLIKERRFLNRFLSNLRSSSFRSLYLFQKVVS